jgi:hypothetical protein
MAAAILKISVLADGSVLLDGNGLRSPGYLPRCKGAKMETA